MHDGKPTALPGPIQVSRFGTLWRRLFSIRGASPEPIPVLNVNQGYDDVELARLRDERLAAGSALAAAVAAQNSFVGIQLQGVVNPLIARIEQIVLQSTVAGLVRIGFSGTNGTTSAIAGPRDNRWPLGNLSQGLIVISGSAGALPAGLSVAVPIQANVPLLLPWPWVVLGQRLIGGISPSLLCWHETQNSDLYGAFLWRARTFEDSENVS